MKISEAFQKLVGRRCSVVELGKKQAISNDRYDWEQAGISPLTSILKIFYSLPLQGDLSVSITTIKFIFIRNIIGHLQMLGLRHRTNIQLQVKGVLCVVVMFPSLYSRTPSFKILIKSCVSIGFDHTLKQSKCTEMTAYYYLSTLRSMPASLYLCSWEEVDRNGFSGDLSPCGQRVLSAYTLPLLLFSLFNSGQLSPALSLIVKLALFDLRKPIWQSPLN